MQKLSVYIRDNSVNLYREETLKWYSPDYSFPFWDQKYTIYDIQYTLIKTENIANYHFSQTHQGITYKKNLVNKPVSNYPGKETSMCEIYIFIYLLPLCHSSLFLSVSLSLSLSLCMCVCIIIYLNLSIAYL